jgi:hypothetical protein
MGRGDNKLTRKIRRSRAQNKKKAKLRRLKEAKGQ